MCFDDSDMLKKAKIARKVTPVCIKYLLSASKIASSHYSHKGNPA